MKVKDTEDIEHNSKSAHTRGAYLQEWHLLVIYFEAILKLNLFS